jgi:capsular polysaccharide biosynthesis protein
MSQGLEESEQAEHFRVLDPANFSNQPTFPKVPIFAGGGFAGGLALGLALTLFLETQDTSMRSERDVEIALHLPVLVSIPVVKYDAKAAKRNISILKPTAPAARTGTRA